MTDTIHRLERQHLNRPDEDEKDCSGRCGNCPRLYECHEKEITHEERDREQR